MQVRVNTKRYLDEEGLQELWEKIKEYVAEHGAKVNPEDIEVDLSGYVTAEQLADALKELNIESPNLADYFTAAEIVEILVHYAKAEHEHTLADITDYKEPDLSLYATYTDVAGLVTKEQLDEALDDVEVDLTGYATETYVGVKIAEAQLEGAEVDLSVYATKDYVDDAIADIKPSAGTHLEENAVIVDYELAGDLLEVELPAISLSNEAGYIVETNFTYDTIGINGEAADENGFCINDYLKRKGVFVPVHEGDTVGFKDYFITGIDFEEEPEVELVGNIIQFENTDAGSPFGKRINVYGMSYDITQELLMKYYVSCYPTDELTLYTSGDISKTYFTFNSNFKWQAGLFDNAYFVNYSNTSYGVETMPEYSYIYRIEAPESESGYVTLKGAKGLFFKGDDWDDSTAEYSLVASDCASFTGTTNTMAAGDIIWVLTDATLDDIYFADGIDDSVASEDTVLPDGEEVGNGFVFYNNTDEESPWGKKVRIFKKLTSLTSTSSIIDGVFCCSEEDLDIHTNGEDIVKYLYFNDEDEWVFSCFYDEGYLASYYKIGEKEYIAPVYDYLYKFTAPETESGYVHVEGVDGEWFDGTYWTSGNCFKPLTMTKNPRSDLNYPSGETHIRSGKTMWLLTNTLLNMEDITVTDSGEPTSTASYSTWGIKKDFEATMSITDRETAKKVTYTFTLPSKNKHTYTGNDYIRFSSEPLYKRYEHRDIRESHKYYGDETYDSVPTVGYVHNYVEDCLLEIEGGSVEIPEVDLSGYVKTEDMTAALETKADKEHEHSEYLTEHQDISGKADVEHTHKMEDITDYIAPDLAEYATKEYVTDAINSASLEGSEVDLSSYAKKDHTHTLEDITDYVAPDLTNYATKDDIPDLTNYVTKDEIPETPDTSKFLTEIPEEYVTQSELETALKDVDVDLSGYAKTEDIEAAINELPEDLYEVAKANGGAVKQYVSAIGTDGLAGYVKSSITMDTSKPVYLAPEISLYNLLGKHLEAFSSEWSERKFNTMLNNHTNTIVIIAATVANLTTDIPTAENPAYFMVYSPDKKYIKIIKYTGDNSFTLYKTLYREDKAQCESFVLPAAKWYLELGMLNLCKANGYYLYDKEKTDALDILEEGSVYTTTDTDILKLYGFVNTTFSYKETDTSTATYIDIELLNEGAQIELLNLMSFDEPSGEKEPIYYTREEWVLAIEQGGSTVDLSEYVTETELNEALDGLVTGGADLTNYYTKDETYNKEEIDTCLTGYLKFEVVTVVPETQEEGVLYIVTG